MTGPRSTKHTNHLHQGRQDRLLRELIHDPYHSKRKLPEPTACPGCGAVYHEGRWSWAARPDEAHQELCPACQRQRDKVPAGFLSLSGAFFQAHRDEIMHLIHNLERREKSEHPLKRIMAIEMHDDSAEITFTDPHLARGAGEALHHAYKGELEFAYSEEDPLLRVEWRR
ncbi:MAG TPA: BCAM0308 family protein [Candidatus Competibacteraceae bacterium]|nr:BCAM0308 family protein [Candidatus Competibacteraceae bacterium]